MYCCLETVTYNKNEMIARKGQELQHLYRIKRGTVKAEITTAEGSFTKTMEEGDVFGEMGFFDLRSNADISAVTTGLISSKSFLWNLLTV